VTVDPDTYETQLLIDDDAGADLSSETLTGGGTYGGLINGMAIVSATKGYLLIYSGWQDVSLRSFNPTTGEVSDPIEGFANQDLSSLAVDSQGRLWVGSGSSIMILNSSTDTLVQTTSLNLNVSTLKILSY
jgi:ligand-binding sensor domain-containing protein